MPLADFIETSLSKSQNKNTQFVLYKLGLMIATVGFLLRLTEIDFMDTTPENEREKMSFSFDQSSINAYMSTCLMGLGIALAKNSLKPQESYSNWIKRSFELNKLSQDVSLGCSIGMLLFAFNMTHHITIGFFYDHVLQNNPIDFYRKVQINDSDLYLDPMFWLYSVILGPFIEEISSRGSITPFLAEQFEGVISKQHARTWAITFDSLQFMLEHPKVSLFRFFMGLSLNELTELTDGRLMAAVSAHAMNNLFAHNMRLFGANNTAILMTFLTYSLM